ncbi:MAG: LytTR family DNA-binding domain-containing protein [Bacteroidota bacterium]
MKAIIVEDEVLVQKTLISLLNKYCHDVEVLGCSDNIDDALEMVQNLNPDLLFLDIQLQNATSFDLLRRLENFSFQCIFITAFAQYAIKAIKFNALDYLLKPVDVDELIGAVNKAKAFKSKNMHNASLENFVKNEKLSQKEKRITLTTQESLEFIKVSNIIRCEAQGSYTLFITSEKGNILVSKHIKTFEEILGQEDFIRPHQSHLVNREHVERYVKKDGGYILMSDGSNVSVSKHKKSIFLAWLVG